MQCLPTKQAKQRQRQVLTHESWVEVRTTLHRCQRNAASQKSLGWEQCSQPGEVVPVCLLCQQLQRTVEAGREKRQTTYLLQKQSTSVPADHFKIHYPLQFGRYPLKTKLIKLLFQKTKAKVIPLSWLPGSHLYQFGHRSTAKQAVYAPENILSSSSPASSSLLSFFY